MMDVALAGSARCSSSLSQLSGHLGLSSPLLWGVDLDVVDRMKFSCFSSMRDLFCDIGSSYGTRMIFEFHCFWELPSQPG